MWYKSIAGRFFGLVTKHTCDRQADRQTDRRTDGQNYDSQDRASIAASRGKNYKLSLCSKCPPFALTSVQTGVPLSCHINNMLVNFTVMSP